MFELKEDIALYEKMYPDWFKTNKGQWVLISDAVALGFHDSIEEAIHQSRQLSHGASHLIRQILPKQPNNLPTAFGVIGPLPIGPGA
ncbi:MAG: hypothetical protein P4M15_12055 [Alphaproteobacteria bacterium]|nr:hypothetical protein [Alphaproteobacteria bacterium]